MLCEGADLDPGIPAGTPGSSLARTFVEPSRKFGYLGGPAWFGEDS
jgi:hypothetical protein